MGISTGNGGRNGMMAEINVTPFVDVMLVLLIIFMVTAPMMTQGLDVDLPQTRKVDVLPSDVEHLVLTISKDGAMMLDKYKTDISTLQAQVKQNVVAAKKQLFLKADKDVPYGLVVQAMSEIRLAGVEKLGVVAEQAELPAAKTPLAPPPATPAGAKPKQ
ncbi:MAG: ExbD/TolR family protein [Desulfovibrio sp.]|nr:ExbD/TolR family protein [Desulfovibrio sp.]